MMNKRLKNRLWLVTCLALAIITTYTIYRYYCVHRIGDSDFYWHIMLGKNAISGLSADDSLVWPNSIYQTSYTNYSLLSDIILYKLSCIREDETFGALVYMLITAFITSFIVFAGWGRNVIKKSARPQEAPSQVFLPFFLVFGYYIWQREIRVRTLWRLRVLWFRLAF